MASTSSSATRANVERAVERAQRDHLVEVEVEQLDHLFVVPGDPWSTSPAATKPVVEEIGDVLACLRRLPDDLAVRINVTGAQGASRSREEVEAAVHRQAARLAEARWRDALAVRSMGWHQTPLGVVIGVVGAIVAYGSAAAVASLDALVVRGLLGLLGLVSLTVAWVAGWVTLEAALLDWRLDARAAMALDLVAGARVDVVATHPASTGPGATSPTQHDDGPRAAHDDGARSR